MLPFWPKHPLIPDRPVPHLLVDVRGEEETLTVTTDQGNERSKSNRPEADKVVCSADKFSDTHSLIPHLHTLLPFSPSLISLMVSADVKHNVYSPFDSFLLCSAASAACLTQPFRRKMFC